MDRNQYILINNERKAYKKEKTKGVFFLLKPQTFDL